MKKKILFLPLLLLLSASTLTGCGMSKEEAQIQEMVNGGNSDVILQSKIINPYALINSFNTDVDRAVSIFNAQRLAIYITPDQVLQGNIIIPNSDGTQETRNCLYVMYDEAGYIDKDNEYKEYVEKNPSRTSLVCSIDEDYYGMLDYANGTENGTYVEGYYLVGSLSSVVGNKQYNLFMNDCALVPAPNMYAVEVPDTSVQEAQTLDVSSSETITFTLTNKYYGSYDFDRDGYSDVLNIQYQNPTTSSSFDKIINSGIIKKIAADLNPVLQVAYGDYGKTSKFSYPVQILQSDLIPSSALDGTDVYVLDTVIEGKNKTDLNYTDNKDIYEDMIPNLVENPICMDTQESLLSIGKDSVTPFTVKLLDGTEDTTLNSSRILFNNLKIDALGNITGGIYIKTQNPFEHYYQGAFRIVDEKTIEEVEIDDVHNFYDVETFELTDNFKTSTKGFKLRQDLMAATDKKVFVSYKLNSKNGELTTGTGKTKDELNVSVVKCNTGDYLNIFSLEKDSNGQYWLDAEYQYGDNRKKTVYIPVIFNNSIVNSERNVQVYGTGKTLDDLLYFGD